ncbi:cyanophycinase [Rhodovibrio sodomensis]|uniref:Cyanophycinase n=1 Tax=Rhodovibrio sodomensis TaxID=1088 RepID=A0ABS1DBQ1_9PROT|nr:cyanophycinase [Rhodovibrio sodomensis]MBK1666993.1 cyanophycinase [Rhodovibrio sodomensis]
MATTPCTQQRGCLVAIGGAEDKTSGLEVLSRVVDLADRQAPVVSVIASASRIPDAVLPDYVAAFTRLGAAQVHALRVADRAEAMSAEAVAAVMESHIIFLTGGDQSRLVAILGGSALMRAILARHDEGAVIAGTSAGAAAMSTAMITGGGSADALYRDTVSMSSGLGLVRELVIDTHFLERGRFTRLMSVTAANPGMRGIGLGEDAALIMRADGLLEAIGPGHAVVVDGRAIDHTNAAEVESGAPIAVANIVLHAFSAGYGYDTISGTALTPERLRSRMAAQRTPALAWA